MESNELKFIIKWDRICSYQAGLRASKWGHHFTAKYTKYRNEGLEQLKDIPKLDENGLYSVNIDCFFKYPKNISKKKQKEIQATDGVIWASKYIDRDNIIKGVNDLIEESGVIANDCYVVDGNTRKLMDKDFKGYEWVEISIKKVGTFEKKK